MAKYIPGTTISYGKRKGGVYYHPDSDEPIGYSMALADAGYKPVMVSRYGRTVAAGGVNTGAIILDGNTVYAPVYTEVPTGRFRRDDDAPVRPHDPHLEVWDVNGKSVRRYACRATLDMIESEILTADRKGLGMAKLNRDGHKAWLRARTDAHNATLLEMWRSHHPEAVAS